LADHEEPGGDSSATAQAVPDKGQDEGCGASYTRGHLAETGNEIINRTAILIHRVQFAGTLAGAVLALEIVRYRHIARIPDQQDDFLPVIVAL